MRKLALCALVLLGCHSSSKGNKNDGGSTSKGDGGSSSSGDGGSTSVPTSCVSPVAAPSTTPTVTLTDCSEAALQTAITAGGVIAFDCGTKTIAITKGLTVPGDKDITLVGDDKITLDGGGTTRILSMDGTNYRVNTHQLSLLHLTLTHGKATGTKMYASAPSPCSQGYYDGYGGAVLINDDVLYVDSCTFDDNHAEQIGPDVAGGAIEMTGCLHGTIINSTFTNNSASNAGAIGGLNSDFDVYGGTFTNNTATGNGANSDDMSKCSVKADNGQYQVGSGGNSGAIGIDGGSDGTHTICGATFKGNQAGQGALGGAMARTPDISKQTTTFVDCTFDSNSSPSGGGALYFHNSTLVINGSTFTNNTAQACGAIQSDASTFDFSNDTFEGNSGTNIAGTLCGFGNDGKISYSTFANNKSGSFAAAIFGNPNLTIEGCLFQNDTSTSAPGDCQTMGSGKDDLDWPMATALCESGDTYRDAMLGSIGDHGGTTPTMVPSAGSPAIGAGHDCPATDQRGNKRPSSGCTIGAVEGSM